MNPLVKPSLVIAIAASLASAPLVALFTDAARDTPAYVSGLLHLSPILLGLVAAIWYLGLHAQEG